MDYELAKGSNGWSATSDFPISNLYRIHIVTSKHTKGGAAAGVSTYAYVQKLENGMVVFDLFNDYNNRIGIVEKRCTEKTVRELHEKVLADGLENLLHNIRAHYLQLLKQRPANTEYAHIVDAVDNMIGGGC